MPAWHRRAQATLSELPGAEGGPWGSVYEVCSDLLAVARTAHRSDDDTSLRAVYSYAQWAWHQRRGSSLQNAIAVGFYEHLFDEWENRGAVVPWLEPSVRDGMLPLWEHRLSIDQTAVLKTLLSETTAARWRELRGPQ